MTIVIVIKSVPAHGLQQATSGGASVRRADPGQPPRQPARQPPRQRQQPLG